MKSKFERTKKGLELVVTPENDRDRTVLNEFVNDCHHKVFLPLKWKIRIERKNDCKSVANLLISRQSDLTHAMISQYGFSSYTVDQYQGQLFCKAMSGFTYILLGGGVYTVFKTRVCFDCAWVDDSGNLNLVNNGYVVEQLHKRKNRVTIIGTLSELEMILEKNKYKG